MRIFHYFYVQPMNYVYIETVVMLIIWTAAMGLLRGKPRKLIAATGAALSVMLILFYTVYGRGENNQRVITLLPFISFTKAKIQPEIFRSMYMNMLLFMPLGMSLPFALPDKLRFRPLIAVIAGLLLSIAVEAIQYALIIGECEVDDVIMNTFGVFIGTSSYLIVLIIMKIKNKKKLRHS